MKPNNLSGLSMAFRLIFMYAAFIFVKATDAGKSVFNLPIWFYFYPLLLLVILACSQKLQRFFGKYGEKYEGLASVFSYALFIISFLFISEFLSEKFSPYEKAIHFLES